MRVRELRRERLLDEERERELWRERLLDEERERLRERLRVRELLRDRLLDGERELLGDRLGYSVHQTPSALGVGGVAGLVGGVI